VHVCRFEAADAVWWLAAGGNLSKAQAVAPYRITSTIRWKVESAPAKKSLTQLEIPFRLRSEEKFTVGRGPNECSNVCASRR
jgi:hypothetical protein